MDPEITESGTEVQQQSLKERVSQMARNKKFLALLGASVVVILLAIAMAFATPGQDSKNNDVTQNEGDVRETPAPVVTIHKKQQEADQEYASWERKVKNDYPWMNKIPLRTDKYFLYFDLSKKVFVGLIYPAQGDDPEKIKAEVINEMKARGIKTEDYKIEWTVNP